MKPSRLITVAIICNLISSILFTAYPDDLILLSGAPNSGEHPVRVVCTASNDSCVSLIFTISQIELSGRNNGGEYEAEIRGEGHTTLDYVPSLPVISRLVAVPENCDITVEYKCHLSQELTDISIAPNNADINLDREITTGEYPYLKEKLFPEKIVEIGSPAKLRDFRVVRVSVNPLQYNPLRKILYFYDNIEVTLKIKSAVQFATGLKTDPGWLRLYQSKIVNFPQLDLAIEKECGSNLIIAPDLTQVLSIVDTLVNLRNRQGLPTVLATLAETGSTSTEILQYIQNAYDTFDPKLAYLTIIGDCAGAIAVPASNETGDHDYTRLDGDDILPDIAVGRYSCANNTQLYTEVNKVIEYETNPYMGQTSWYTTGSVVAGNAVSGISTIQTKQGIKYKALQYGYARIDTLWYTMGGSVPIFTTNCINSGTGFYNYRGVYGMEGFNNSSVDLLVNFHKLPFVATITCATGDITTAESAISEEFFRVGTPTNPTGAIGAVGTASTTTHTRHNNCLDNGIFAAFFDYDIYELGYALNVGKIDLYISYPDNPTSVESACDWNNLIGDPCTQLWTQVPQKMLAQYQNTIPVGTTLFSVSVIDSLSGAPLPEVYICLYGDDINLTGASDSSGFISFALPIVPQQVFSIICRKHNYIPRIGTVAIQPEDIYLAYFETEIDDDSTGISSGNNNNEINPFETIELGVSLKNYGNLITATNVQASLNCEDAGVTILDSTQNYPNILPGGNTSLVFGFAFSLNQNFPDQQVLDFDLNINSNEGFWTSYLPLLVSAPDVVYESHIVLDADSLLTPGETADIEVNLINQGGLTAAGLTGIISSSNQFLEFIQDSVYYGLIEVGQTNTGSSFTVKALSNAIPGSSAEISLSLTGDNGYFATTSFTLAIGEATAADPTGPDEYGYYALDNSDSMYSGYPQYQWVEIDPTVPGHQFDGIDLQLTDFGSQQDDATPSNLPFVFKYYGENYDDLAICSNGWIAFGGELAYFTDFQNWPIPSPLGPPSLVAVFWDDLYQQSAPPKKVYKYYDATDHRFIIEWNVINMAPLNYPEKFEVILLDPAYYPTQTGDGIILIQYQEVHNVFGSPVDNHFATVGIKNSDNLIGIQYTYWNYYAPGAAVLIDSRALKFTTDTPVRLVQPVIDDLWIEVSGTDIRLSWDPMPNASAYNVYRSTEPYFDISLMSPIAQVTVNTFTDSDALSEAKYFYCVTWE